MIFRPGIARNSPPPIFLFRPPIPTSEVRNKGKNYVWLDPSVRVRRQPTVIRRSHELGAQGFDPHSKVEIGSGRFNWYQSQIMVFKPTIGYPPVSLRYAPRVSGMPEPCGARIAAQADYWSPETCEECGSDGLGVSGTCEDCGSD
ncbi:unnamed protein product [Prunus armeniaca]